MFRYVRTDIEERGFNDENVVLPTAVVDHEAHSSQNDNKTQT